MKKSLTGINIQYPISQLILNGKKTIETRTYPIPDNYINQDLYLIETPGNTGDFRARIVGIINFGKSFQYKSSKDFYKDSDRHFVTPNSIWKWIDEKEKWGWPINSVVSLSKPIPAPAKKGIKFTRNIFIG